MHSDIIDWQKHVANSLVIVPWKPTALSHDQWPPDYKGVYAWRIHQTHMLLADPKLVKSAIAYYKTRPAEFIMHWMDTYDPRKIKEKWIPFVFFEKQAHVVEFLHELRADQESGLIEKCRDAGATWLACAYSIWSWLFIDADAIGWGSRKQELVDKIGDASSIFEKLRLLIRRLPPFFLPEGLDEKRHLTFMKCINPATGATITGETGDNIGRGGRTSMYFKDESAHYERPEKIEAALGDTTRVQVDISSVNGVNNPFHRRREAGVDWFPGRKIESGFTRVLVIDWRDHPEKTQEWYDTRKAKYEREGLQHLFAQEVDRNYSAAISNTIIPYEWIMAAVDAHEHLSCMQMPPHEIPDLWIGGLDVADGGIDRNAFAVRQWIIMRSVEEWGERDPGTTTQRALGICKMLNKPHMKVMYDAIGVGSGVKTEYNRLSIDEGLKLPKFVPWNAGASVLDPFDYVVPNDHESLSNKDFFENLKAQAWWHIRGRFYKTFRVRFHGAVYPADELISLDSRMPLLNQLTKEFAQPVRKESSRLKTMVDKTPEGMKSPNLADSAVMAYFPIPDDYSSIVVGSYS